MRADEATFTWAQIEHALCWILGMVHVSLGLAVWFGGAERFPPPNYTALLDLTGGYVWPYATLWAVGGVTMAVASGRLRLFGIALVLVVTWLWASLFFVATLQNSTASFTPTAAYGGYGVLNAVLFGLVWFHLEKRDV